MGRSLVLSRVGGSSLHFCQVAQRRPRNWDLYLSPYQETPPQSGLYCIMSKVIPGPKGSGFWGLLTTWDDRQE